jgi:2-polyprenyl-6-methoxyphenol hydroxylase-like FAD-dependent oxidoreductase
MRLEADFIAKAAKEQGMQVVDKDGRCRAFFPAKTGATCKRQAQSFTSEYEIMRGDFVSILYEAARAAGVEHLFGTTLSAFVDNSCSVPVKVRLDQGEERSYDLVVGADGVHSSLRAMMLDSAKVRIPSDGFCPIPGTYIGYFNAPCPIEPDEKYVASL